jgi:hypothetical protein
MITNNKVTIYHLRKNTQAHKTEWVKFNYEDVWFFGGKGAGINKGYDQANNVDVRIPYGQNDGLDINNFAIGDIIVEGHLTADITTQQDLKDYTIYNITSITDANFGGTPHIHIGGR